MTHKYMAAAQQPQYETQDSGQRDEWLTAETDEDHAVAVESNLLAAETIAYRIEQGVKNGELGF
ncbi:hypothetical protein ACWDBD_21510 [Streptomyces sp. NPDC001118]